MHASRCLFEDAALGLPRRFVSRHPHWLVPDWGAQGVAALMTTRDGGVSTAPFDSLNLRDGLGDDPAAVILNQDRFAAATGGVPIYLNQVHGCRVLRLAGDSAALRASRVDADASVTSEVGLACTVLVADCLPVLFAAPAGRAVGAAHAGWRGLAAGVLEATLEQVCALADCPSSQVLCWLGPCIGPRHFEVGPDVLLAFGVEPARASGSAFKAIGGGKWLADLPELARQRLRRAGVVALHGGQWCTFSQPERFYSFRRERETGRMAAAVWISG